MQAYPGQSSMQKFLSLAAIAVFVLILVLPAHAQAQHYARVPRDTLQYAVRTRVNVTVQTPQGEVPVTVAHDADIAMTFIVRDTLRAWYTGLSVSAESPMGRQEPSATAVLGEPFIIAFAPGGATRTISTPRNPPGFQGVSDVTREFGDFFLVLPERALEKGMSWDYHVEMDEPTVNGGRYAFDKTGTLTVVGDTTVGGREGLKIVGVLNTRLENTVVVPEQGMKAITSLSGAEHATFVYSAERGVMLARATVAHLNGTTEYQGGPMPMSMEQDIRYQSEIRLEH